MENIRFSMPIEISSGRATEKETGSESRRIGKRESYAILRLAG
jgi:hypothetical protein